MAKNLLAVLFLLISQCVSATTDEPDQAVRAELRALMQGVEQAVNTEKYGDLKQFFDENLRITTINQQVIRTPAGIDAYFSSWFGKDGYLKRMDIKLLPDEPPRLYGPPGNPTWGLAYGVGIENYRLTDGRYLPMKTRWTATVIKGADGKWRILTLHIGTNFYDNPIVTDIRNESTYHAAGGVIVGLLLGAILTLLYRRRKRQPNA